MKLKDLPLLDPTFKLLTGGKDDLILSAISHSHNPKPDTFCFVKNKKFYEDLGIDSESKDFTKTGVVFEEDFFSKQMNFLDSLRGKFSWIATVKDVSVSMCLFSKPFYDEKFENLNYFVDGRQMGTATIDSFSDIAQNVFIGENVVIEKNVKIYPNSVIMPEVTIKEGTIIFPNVTIYPYTIIGKNCRIHSGTIIGADGFGYHFNNGAHQKIWHFSGVVIENDVEIGASSTVDAGAFLPTQIGSGSKIDNGVQIGHNAQLGKHVIVCGQAGIAGSAKLKDYVVLAANSGVAPGAVIGKGSILAARAAVSDNSVIEPGSKLGGFPAENFNTWLKQKAAIRNLLKK